MSRRKSEDKTTAELMAEENAALAAAAGAYEAWREAALTGSGWFEVPVTAMEYLYDREPDAERAALVLLAWEMGARWPVSRHRP